ncbi:MAG: TIGR04295 family B12-binding domain-containing radical SAM protein [Desulfuromonadales bacterium]|nr:TIGR04295 family B12-binding domain-containing radical SAM protein [Desulfuromonadales bacterium]
MKFALVNPHWDFQGSVYFGCPEPHLPLEFGYAAALLRQSGHQVLIVDAHLHNLCVAETASRVDAFSPAVTLLATAPTYLFWRCPPPELRLPQLFAAGLRQTGGLLLAVGPHGSATPGAVLDKLPVDGLLRGEFEELLPLFADRDWRQIPGIAYREGEGVRLRGKPGVADLSRLPPLTWPADWLGRHRHHHHRFDADPQGPGAEVESSRGCPYHCLFCAKENFRGIYRRRPLPLVLQELDGLLAQGVEYVYFIDEIFLPDSPLLNALAERRLRFGIQTRIDLWPPPALERLGAAGCVSIEAGVESLSVEGRRRMGKPCHLTTEQLAERLALAKAHVPFVQANLLLSEDDDPAETAAWRRDLIARGVWVNDPVPLFPFPGSGAYRQRWGEPDDLAWERAHAWYLDHHPCLSDLQDRQPQPLATLEASGAWHG